MHLWGRLIFDFGIYDECSMELGFCGGNYRTKPNYQQLSRVSYGIVKKLRLALPKLQRSTHR
ncbi:hypothetical protein [Nostoc sp. 106C]|uniref:hypothetical protein n=1 Tax=Nostoc sp. 106C TaxID=1932667 RepID=UPI0014136E7C|nr:hypothetical protein [Nostoc sp. 106C]